MMGYRMFLCVALLASSVCARAAEVPVVHLVIRNHHFVPAQLHIPARTKVKLEIVNEDASAEEFESYALNREKVVVGGGTIAVYVGPLAPGSYAFFGDFHPKDATGILIAE